MLLRDYIEYFHIKDSLYAGAIVPPGCGEAQIAEIFKAHSEYAKGDFYVTLEPHLQTFSGLHALVGKSFDNPYKFETQEAAFAVAVSKIKEIIA
jgi:sugar phosphate isomerase/epimerase